MHILGFNLSLSRRQTAAVASSALACHKSLCASPLDWLRGQDLARGGAALSNAYQQVVWVYRAINVLAEQVANIPFRFSIGEAGGDRLLTSGPLLDFYARPHPQINRFQYWELRIIWLMLRGECMRVPIYSDSNNLNLNLNPDLNLNHPPLARVLILDPAHFQHIVENQQLIGWRYTGFGPQAPLESQVFLPEEVWFEKLPNPFDFWRGLSPLAVAALAAKTDFAAGAFMREFIENNADTGLIVRTQEPLGAEQEAQLIAALNNRKRRAGASDRPLLLSGVAEINRPQLSSSDLQFLENRKFSRGEICAAFGVPEEIVTTTDTAKYDVMAGARLNFIENRIAPLCRRLEAVEEATVKALDPQASGWFDLDSLPILQDARRSRLTSARTGFEMGVPFNELNRVLDLGFKPLPWGETGWVAGNLKEVGREAEGNLKSEGRGSRAERSPKSEGRNSKGEEVQSLQSTVHSLKSEGRGSKAEGRPKFEVRNTKEGSEELLGRAERLFSGLSQRPPFAAHSPVLSKLRRFRFEQRGRVLASLTQALGNSVPIPPIPSITPIPPRSPIKPAAIFDLASENQALRDLLKPLLVSELAACASQPAGEPDSAQAKVAPEGLEEYLATRLPAFEALNQATATALEQTLAAGQGAGEAPDQLAARVRAVFNETGR